MSWILPPGTLNSLALKNDGSVVAWGWNGNGQTSVPFGALYNVAAVAAGHAHNLAVDFNGKVLAWGRDNRGTRG